MKKANLFIKALVLLLSFVMVLQLAACGDDGKAPDSGKANVAGNKGDDDSSNQPERVKGLLFPKRENPNPDMTLIYWWAPKQDLEEINALYESIYGGKVNFIEKTWGQRTATVSAYVAAGTPCEAFIISETSVPEWPAAGLLEEIPMDKLDKDSPYWNFDSMNTTYSFNGKVYGLAYKEKQLRFSSLIYNEKLFNQYGVKTPYEHFKEGNWDFDQFRKTAAEMTMDTDDDGFTDLFGFDASYTVMHVLCRANAVQALKFNNNKYTLNMDDPRFIATYQLYSDMFNVDKSMNQTDWKHYQNFFNGRTAMAELSLEQYGQLHLDGMKYGTAGIGIMPSGPAAKGKYFGASEGHLSFASAKGTNNMDATIAWMECAISVWLKLGDESPRECIDYMYTEADKARINELSAATILFKDSGLKYNAQGVEGRGYVTANVVTFESMLAEIRKNKAVMTVFEKYKPIYQGQLNQINQQMAVATK